MNSIHVDVELTTATNFCIVSVRDVLKLFVIISLGSCVTVSAPNAFTWVTSYYIVATNCKPCFTGNKEQG